jgi:hypothetical protein
VSHKELWIGIRHESKNEYRAFFKEELSILKLNDVGTALLNYDAFLEARLSHSIRRTAMSDHFLFIVFWCANKQPLVTVCVVNLA